jgi:pilus assembly protein CpaB
MKPKTVILLAVAVGSGLLAMIGVQQAMSGTKAQVVEDKAKVLVAMTDIEIGVPLDETNVEFREFPVSAVTFPDPVMTPEQYEKRSPRFALRAGDMIALSRLSEPGIHGKSQQIDKGMRVLTIPVDDTGSFSGLLQAGDRVDVLVTYNYRDQRGRQQAKTMTLLEYVQVFATDDKTAREASSAGDGKNKTRTVALLLAPEHVPYVKLAESKGKLALSWRRRDDDVLASTGPINEELLDELRGLDSVGGGFDQYSQPLYGPGPDDDVGFPPTGDFSGVGQAANPAPANDVNATLNAAEGTTTTQVAEAPAAPPKPMWKLQIYTGNEVLDQEFEIPEEQLNDPALKEVSESLEGGQLWSLLKQAL